MDQKNLRFLRISSRYAKPCVASCRVNHNYNWVRLLPYLLRGKYDVAPIYALWGKYGCSSTRYWVSMGAPVLVTGTCYWVSMDLQNASADQIKGIVRNHETKKNFKVLNFWTCRGTRRIFEDPSRYAMDQKYLRFLRISSRYAKPCVASCRGTRQVRRLENGIKRSDLHQETYFLSSLRRLSHQTRKTHFQSIKTSILKASQGLDRTRERFCKSGSSFYPQNSAG
ncbi:hypothetical protein E3N88_33175 [Mikania micrantha]|uniref:Uncharacterized protein n=1 Tax=Mikania micrantha TaxID=192012 RepID=A0A5N6MAI2_9ASTR|nr:hypothetical protein E3N88_33175 [Mikania micrantha]